MICPFCNKKLAVQHKGLFLCPEGHGALVTGKYLSDIENSPYIDESKTSTAVDSVHQIVCPHCSTEMHKVDYNSTDIIIDACTNCHYRWLDTGETSKIREFKPKFNAEDLLVIASLEEKIRQSAKREIKEANPRLPLQGSWRGGSEILGFISGKRTEVRYSTILGQGLYGLYRGLMHSKWSRILVVATLLIFGILLYLVYIDAQNTLGL